MTGCTEIERWIIRYVNQARRQHGLSPFRTNWGLTGVARSHSSRMARARKIWHGDGVHQAGGSVRFRSLWDFLASLFYRGCSGENVAIMYEGRVRGFKHPIQSDKQVAFALHRSWMNSPGHRANILNSDFKMIGVGVKRNGNGFYGTELFYG